MEDSLDNGTTKSDGGEELELNVTDCMTNGGVDMVRNEYQDATENSSSFSKTACGTSNGSVLSDAEVQSQFRGDDSLTSVIDGRADVFRLRKKKLTAHWRNYIRPLMWRCKWMELQIKELQSQASKYAKELAECNHSKLFELENYISEGFVAKSLPVNDQIGKRKIMRRKKRKRIEEKTDVTSYMCCHNLFPYYENKRSAANTGPMNDGCVKLDKTFKGDFESEADDEHLFLESRDGNNCMEPLLQKISLAQARVHKLKGRINELSNKNDGTLPSTNNHSSLAECAARISPVPSSDLTPGNKCSKSVGTVIGTVKTTTPWSPDYCSMPDLLFSESAVLGRDGAMLIHDITGNAGHSQVEQLLNTDGEGLFLCTSKEGCRTLKEERLQFMGKVSGGERV